MWGALERALVQICRSSEAGAERRPHIGWWICWVGPVSGTLLAILVCNALALKVEVATLNHFDSDRSGLLRRRVGTAEGDT